MELARHLQSKGYRINFLGLYDAVDMAPGFGEGETIPSNVDYGVHAMGSPKLHSRPYFNTADHGPEDASKMKECHIEKFWATHGGMGGAPWPGDHPHETAQVIDENISSLVDQWMRKYARSAGIPMPPTPKIN